MPDYSPAANPSHVENLNTLAQLKADGFEGGDVSLEISLGDYGLAWRDLGDEWLFIYRHPSLPRSFDRCTLAKSTDAKHEWNWVKWVDLANYLGQSVEETLAQPLPRLVSDLISYYGTEEIFGSNYWEGFQIEGVTFDND